MTSMQNELNAEKFAYLYIQTDRELHDFLAKQTDNRFLIKAISDIRDLVDWMGFRALLRKERLKEVQQEHEVMITALEEGNRRRALTAMSRHILITRDKVVEWFRSQAKDGSP